MKFKKLIIQIPCLNEAETLPVTLADLPRKVDGFDVVEWLVIDDGSTDNTAEVAKRHGVDHVLRLPFNRGLARAFMAGLEHSLRLGADVIINTDADNQYSAASIPDLVAPILSGQAQMVVGARPINTIEHFSPLKKLLQHMGSWVVRKASGTEVADAPSGFRAFHRDAAMTLNVFNNYTYTLETIIQAGRRGVRVASVPIAVNGFLRPSRLISSVRVYVYRSILTILRIFVLYHPMRFFLTAAAIFAIPAAIAILRFVYLYFTGAGGGNIQSLVIAAGLMAVSAAFFVCGILGDLIATNRMLLEEARLRLMRLELSRTEQAPTEVEPAPVAGARIYG